jgi:hypothetical protein
MNDTMTFSASRRKAFFFLLGSATAVIGGVLMSNKEPIIGWVIASLFGLNIPASIMMMLPNAMYLRLDEHGLEKGSLFGSRRVLWKDVKEFRICTIRTSKLIQIVYSNAYYEQKFGSVNASSVYAMDGAIADSYNSTLDDMLHTLNSWKARFGTHRP